MKNILKVDKFGISTLIKVVVFTGFISLGSSVSFAGQIVDTIVEHIDQIPTVSYCNNANPDRIRLVRKTWACSINKARLVNAAANMVSKARQYEKLNNENTPQGRYLEDRINHFYDRAIEADYQLRRLKCTRRCF